MNVTILRHARVKAWPDHREEGEVLSFDKAIGQRFGYDAHLVTYYADDVETLPRIKKADARECPWSLWTDVMLADIDNPGHAPWNEETLATWMRWVGGVRALDTCGVYATARGWRAVQPLEQRRRPWEMEPMIQAWLEELTAGGVAVDMACRDWTRLFRLPHVVRDGIRFDSPHVDLSRMTPRKVVVPSYRCPAGAYQTQGSCGIESVGTCRPGMDAGCGAYSGTYAAAWGLPFKRLALSGFAALDGSCPPYPGARVLRNCEPSPGSSRPRGPEAWCRDNGSSLLRWVSCDDPAMRRCATPGCLPSAHP